MRRETVFNRIWTRFVSETAFQRIDFAFRVYMGCCLFVLFHFLFDRTLRHALNNHVFIVLLVMCLIWEMTVAPSIINVYLYGVFWPQIPTFCVVLKFLDSCIYTSTAKLVAWASVERHILIFHNQWVSTRKKRLLIHYIPLITIVMYGMMCYAITTPMNDCNRGFYYTYILCGYYSCIYNSVVFSLYEFATGGVLSSFLIGTGSASLLLRIVRQKRRFQRQIEWRKHRKMTIQLLSVTSLFFILYLPLVLLSVTQKAAGVPSYVGADYELYAQFFSNYVIFLFPFACIGTLPQLRTRIKNTFRYCCPRQAGAVVPQQLIMQTVKSNRTLNHRTAGEEK
jgi:hypothetical protein